ncbi:glycosyltransferase family 39 protein [Thermodesulfomicrobium sp. WS]|uniref:glycosyltransferase family 39 protein n=1 Tax=Thermodesulfomicrobium sp. WS TaxID=3004129 RepID=UPI002492AECD|nr:glycosyltransferase family 39 protein [Thermodesulfomicrobium sp. WS]
MTPKPWSDSPAAAQPWLAQHPLAAWLAVAMVAVTLAFGANLSRGLLETTEGRYVLCAQEMLQSGQWLEPTLDGKPHWTKPPLTYWVLAAGMAAVGQVEEGARLAQAVVFLALVGAVVLLARQWGDARLAWWAVVVTLTSLLPLLGVTFVSTDLLLTLWETLAVACYLGSLQRPRPRIWLAGMGLFWGLAFLTKGPPALVPLAAILPWHWWRHRHRPVVTAVGLGLFAVVGLGWYVVEALRHPELVSYWLGQEVVARLTSDTFHRNPQWWKPFVLYLPLLAAGPLPWMLTARLPLRQWWQQGARPGRDFLALWVLIPLGIFFVAKSRLPLYVLPLSIPLVVMLAGPLTRAPLSGRTVSGMLAGVLVLVLAGRLVLTYVPLTPNMRQLFGVVQSCAPQRVLFVEEDELYGLQAYANAAGIPVQRVAVDALGPLAPGSVAVVARKRAAVVQARLQAADLHTVSWADWVVMAASSRLQGNEAR